MQSSRHPLHQSGHDESSLPSLDQVSVCSSCDEDDSSLVSSMSSDEALYQEEKPRSIFRAYWYKKGGRSLQASAQTKELSSFSSSSSSSSSTNTHSRRRIFSKLSEATPTLPLSAALEVNMRKIKSVSDLHGKPKGSCLRPSRFSGRERRKTEASDSDSDSDSSVTFSSKVDIVIFQAPAERWAADGWSDWFA
jgi:hypothetical protein